jgi:hypothetical protein
MRFICEFVSKLQSFMPQTQRPAHSSGSRFFAEAMTLIRWRVDLKVLIYLTLICFL